jgi:nucleotide-binding universal stress UspA family protein
LQQQAVEEVACRHWTRGSEVKVLACVHVPIPDIPDTLLVSYPIRLDMMEAERRRLAIVVEQAATRLRETEHDLKVETAVIDGSPKEAIVDEAEKWGAELIVVGCHGYGNVKRFLLGSVSQTVATHAKCSVEIVRSHHDK